jgi:putative membrane protein
MLQVTDRSLTEAEILAIERPEPSLAAYYVISSLSWGPGFFVALALNLIRFRTLRYRFEHDALSMSWGVLFRREIYLTYARIQDIHLTSNLVERWLGLARIHIQTASGRAEAEMTIEGISAFEALRDFLYVRMRGVRGLPAASATTAAGRPASLGGASAAELAATLQAVCDELRALREDLRRQAPQGKQDG